MAYTILLQIDNPTSQQDYWRKEWYLKARITLASCMNQLFLCMDLNIMEDHQWYEHEQGLKAECPNRQENNSMSCKNPT